MLDPSLSLSKAGFSKIAARRGLDGGQAAGR